MAGTRKLSDAMIRIVYREKRQGRSNIAIAAQYSVSVDTIWRIATGRSHSRVTGARDPTKPQDRPKRRPGDHVHRWQVETAEAARSRRGDAVGALRVEGRCECGAVREFAAAVESWGVWASAISSSPWRYRPAGRGMREAEAEVVEVEA